MYVLTRIAVALIIGLMSYQSQGQNNYTITVIVKNFDSNDGKAFIGLYNTEANFLNKRFKAAKSKIENKQCTLTFENVPAGAYAVSMFHDENDNSKMDTNFFGIPKEDYGCSNDAKGFMGPPKWEDAKFELKENTSLTIKL